MIEIRFHGRGGQGAVVASKILACAFFKEGQWVQSFPAFGVERRGAPVMAFLRVDASKILLRTNVYYPEHLVVLDPTLIDAIDVTAGLKPGGSILINSAKSPADFPKLAAFKVATVDANKLAIKYRLGSRSSPIVNTAILGSFAKSTGLVSIDSVTASIIEEVPLKPENNANAAKEAFENTIL